MQDVPKNVLFSQALSETVFFTKHIQEYCVLVQIFVLNVSPIIGCHIWHEKVFIVYHILLKDEQLMLIESASDCKIYKHLIHLFVMKQQVDSNGVSSYKRVQHTLARKVIS
jgi:hypothetical protein